MNTVKAVLVLTLLSVSNFAYSDVEYYTYGGFESIVNAFTMISVVFNADDYIYIGFVVAVVGISVGILVKSGLSALGKASGYDALGVFILGIFGTSLYMATFSPKTTVHIYDPTVNGYESVGDIPYALAYIASGTNLLERFVTDVVSTTSVFGRDRHANGRSLELLFNLLNSDPLPGNIHLSKSMEVFVDRCVASAAASPGTHSDFDYNAILNGTTDIWSELEKTRNPNQYVVWYDESNPGGTTTNCSDAYDNLHTSLTNPVTFDSFIRSVCQKSGFDGSSDDSFNDCRNLIQDTVPLIYSASVTASPENMTAMSALSHALYDTLANDPGSSIAYIGNNKQLSQGFGSALVAEGWLPAMRSGTLVIILSFTPLMVLMILTPFVGKALHMVTVLFLFLTIWGGSDAIVHSTIIQNILLMFSDLKTFDGGLRGFMLAPTDLQKAIAQFGKMQSLGVMFAGIFCAVFFKFTYYQFANMGEKLSNDIDQTGQSSGMEGINPTGRMHSMIEQEGAAGKYNAISKVGSDLYGAGIQYTSTNYDWGNAHAMEQLRHDHPNTSQTDIMDLSAQNRGGMEAGQFNARVGRATEQETSVKQVATGLGNTQQLSTDSSLDYQKAQSDRLAGTEIQRFDDLARISNPALAGKINVSTRPQDHEKMAETDTAVAQGRTNAFDQVYGSPASIANHSENATYNQIEDANATRAARLEEVEKGNSRSTQAVAHEITSFTTQTTLGNADASEQYVGEGRVDDVRDGAKQLSVNSLRSGLATNKAFNSLSEKTSQDDDDLAYSSTQFGVESTMGAVQRRDALSKALDKDSLQVATQENASVRMATDSGDIDRLNDIAPGSFSPAAESGSASFNILEDDLGNIGLSNPEIVVGGKSVFQGNTNSYAGVEHILEEGSASDVLSLLDSAETPTQQQSLAAALANGWAINRTAAEGESSQVNMGLDGEVYARTSQIEMGPKGVGKAASRFLGGGKGSNAKSPADIERERSASTYLLRNGPKESKGILDRVLDVIPSVSVGGVARGSVGHRSTDSSSDNASINSNQALILSWIEDAKAELNSDDLDDRLQAASEFQELYLQRILEDLENAQEIGSETDPDMIKDKYQNPVEAAIDSITSGVDLSDVYSKDQFKR